MKELFIIWVISMMQSVAPHRYTHIPEALETPAQMEARYREIATAIIDVSFDPQVTPVHTGTYGRALTAMLVASIFHMESGFRKDIDLGTSRARLRRIGLNDFGRSWCMGQLNLGYKKTQDPATGEWVETSNATTIEGWTGADLVADRRKCVTATINALRMSMGTCKHLPQAERLAAYAAGTCDSEAGRYASKSRMRLFNKWAHTARPPIPDTRVLDASAD